MSFEKKSLGEICDFQGGSQPPKTNFAYEPKEGYIRFLQIRDFGSEKNHTYIPISKKNKTCRADDIMIGRYGASVGKILRGRGGAYNVALMKATPVANLINKDFFWHYLNSAIFQDDLRSVASRSAQDGFSKDDIFNFKVPLPPLTTQKKIVAKLDAIFAEIDKASAAAEANAKNADIFLIASIEKTFAKLFKEWKSVTLSEVTELSRGHNPPKSKFVYEPKEGYVRFYQIRDGSSDDRAVYVPDSTQLHKVDKDDILMVAYRHVGRAFRGVEGAFNVALCKIKNKNREILFDDFLFYLIPSSFVRGELLKQSERSLIPSMSITHLKEITVPLPPLKIQKTTVERLKVIEENTLLMKKYYESKVVNLNLLKQAILKQAFNGELVKE